jgi:hypothetical protein
LSDLFPGLAWSFAVAIDEDLTQLDEHVRRLKIEYDVYFGGGSKKPPADLEWKVRNLLKKYSDGTNLNSTQRFRFSTIQQRYALFSALWMQKLKIKEEGYRRPQDAVLGIQGLRAEEQHEAEAALRHPRPQPGGLAPFRIECEDVEAEPQKIETLFHALASARKKIGDDNAGNLATFTKFVRQKTEQIRKEYECVKVEYSVEMKNGQVRLKAKPKT